MFYAIFYTFDIFDKILLHHVFIRHAVVTIGAICMVVVAPTE